MTVCESAIRLDSRHGGCQVVRGQILEARGETDAAEQAYLQAAGLWPRDPEPHFRLGRIAQGRDHVEVAIPHYRRALELDPGHGPSAHYLAIELRGSGEFAEAERLLIAALRAEPKNVSLRFNLAHTYLKRGATTDAAREFRAGLVLQPQEPTAYYFLGHCLELQGRDEEALREYREALSRDAFLHAAWYAVAQLEKARGRDAEAAHARQQFERSRALRDRILRLESRIRKQPRDVGAWTDLAAALLERGQPQKARARAHGALGIDPRHQPAQQILRQAEAELQRRRAE